MDGKARACVRRPAVADTCVRRSVRAGVRAQRPSAAGVCSRLSAAAAVRALFACAFCALVLAGAALAVQPQAAYADAAVTKVVKSGCYVYQSASSATSNRAGYLTFGEEVDVIGEQGGYAVVNVGGAQRYVRASNLSYRSMTVVKNRVQVKTAGKASAPVLDYAYYNDKVSIVDDSGNYVRCLLSDGREGYINKAYLSYTAVPKVVNTQTKLYDQASGSSSATSITAGEEVRMLMSNGTWAKVTYRGRMYFMYADKLDAKVVHLAVNRAYQMKDARVGAERVQYVYWDKACTVLNTYESDTYGTYYYCKIGSKYGFVRAQYFGSSEAMRLTQGTSLYAQASDASEKKASLSAGETVGVVYSNGTWAKVSYGTTTGYVLAKYLAYATCTVDGYAFGTAYQAYAYDKNGTLASGAQKLSGTYPLHGQSSKYACIVTESGLRYVLARNFSTDVSTSAVYAAVPFLTLYERPNSSSASIEVPYMTELSFVEDVSKTSAGTWSKVVYEGAERYVWTAAGSAAKLTSEKSSFAYSGGTAAQSNAIAAALDVLNNWETCYVHGGTGELVPGTNVHEFDCSGFASYVLNRAMQDEVPVYSVSANLKKLFATDVLYNEGIGGQARAQTVWTRGQKLDAASLEPGDLLFFNLAGEADEGAAADYNHVGVYLGNGEFVHCTHTWDRVIIMPLADLYEDGLVKVLRCLPDKVEPAQATYETTSTQTKLRSSMDSSSEDNVLAVLDSHVRLTLLFVNETGTWGYVDAQGTKGYVLMKYLREPVDVQTRQGYVAATSVKLYAAASSSSGAVEAYCTELVELVGMKSGTSYYQVKYQGETRYISLHNKTLESVVTTDLDALLAGTETKTVNANTYVRSTPNSGSDANKVTLLRAGTQARVIAVSSGGSWAYVGYGDGDYGFVLTSKLS